jgi:hypothetical protein
VKNRWQSLNFVLDLGAAAPTTANIALPLGRIVKCLGCMVSSWSSLISLSVSINFLCTRSQGKNSDADVLSYHIILSWALQHRYLIQFD